MEPRAEARAQEVDRRIDTKRSQRGNSVIEVSLMAPWILLLFICVFDFGFYVYAAISVENAARVAALHTSSNPRLTADQGTACFYAVQELQRTANVAALPASFGCAGDPLRVTAEATTVNGVRASQVTVQYETNVGIPLPWFSNIYRITRIVSMRQSDEQAVH
jgi:Flp pilus assembly protein TadG